MPMINPPIGELLSKVDCRYTPAVEAAKRARELVGGAQPLVVPKDTKPLVIAISPSSERLKSLKTQLGSGVKGVFVKDTASAARYLEKKAREEE